MKISDVLADKGRRVVTVWPEKDLGQVAQLFDERNIASVEVSDHAEQPLGIVTDRDILRCVARRGVPALELKVTEAMQSPPPSCGLDDTVNEVLRFMTEIRARHVLVMQGGRLVSIVSIGDLVKFRLKDADLENRVLREIALSRLVIP
jgi:CBS domain-containing protein